MFVKATKEPSCLPLGKLRNADQTVEMLRFTACPANRGERICRGGADQADRQPKTWRKSAKPLRLARAKPSFSENAKGGTMRNAALMLGIIGGIIGMIVGFFSYGYTELVDALRDYPQMFDQVDNVERIRAISLIAPILAIAGGAMSRSQALLGGVLMILSAVGMYWGFGFNAFTMFPVAMVGLGGVLALAARRPDAH